ncbi:MAG: tyrosine-type recombinase/integrase [Spirochaetaceae bacterium]|nr:tyrosine-type recombinase/integrase [Spirochaetaceae bacterium]
MTVASRQRSPCHRWPRTERVLSKLAQKRAPGDAVFLNRQQRPYTRFGVYRLVERCAARVPALAGRKITPHVIRHTSDCHLLQAGVDLNTIRAWLGHASLDTTNIYAEIDLEMKAKAMALCDAAEAGPDRPWKENKGLMAFLGTL